jgi:mono/diheme cytochrome c family protein
LRTRTSLASIAALWVGRTPWYARDPLVPLSGPGTDFSPRANRPTRASAADQGVRPTVIVCVLLALASVGCRQDMHDQPKYIPLRPSEFFADGRSGRPLIEGTIARGHLNDDAAFYTGKGADGKPLPTFPFPVTKELIERGQQRFNVYCSPCHDRLGNGYGMIVRRGYRRPPSYHTDRLRHVPDGYIYDVITNGFGAMADYSAQVAPRDRWAIVAYIRALQWSQNGTVNDVPAEARGQLSQGAAK